MKTLISKTMFLISTLSVFALASCGSKGSARTSENFTSSEPGFNPDIEIQLTAEPMSMQLLTGQKTNVFHYQSELLKGESSNLTDIPDSYLGPIIRVNRGQKIRIIFKNNLPAKVSFTGTGCISPLKWTDIPCMLSKRASNTFMNLK